MLEKRKRTKSINFKLFPFINVTPPAVFTFFLGLSIGLFISSSFKEGWIASSAEKAHIRVCFSPEGQCTSCIITAIEEAKSSILVAAYSFTCPHIATALADSYRRGVDVKILVHSSQLQGKHSQIPFLSQVGIPIFIDPAVGIAHNKIMILDDRYVLTGSFNWTRAAETRNAENVLFIDDPSLAQIYTENWEGRALAAKKVLN